MRNLLLLVALSLCSAACQATIFYVSPNGNNSNPGTINAPLATWDRLSFVMRAGDTAYIRGGVYRSRYNDDASVHCLLQNLHGTALKPIKIWAYPGEFPIFDLSDINPTYTDPTAFVLNNCDYVHLKGLHITGLKQESSGDGLSRGFDLQYSSNCTIEFIELDHIGGYGYLISNGSNNNLFKNCDAHHMDDRLSNPGAWGGSNGFGCTGGTNATGNIFDGCRAWWISDDGFDLFGTNGVFTFKNCWSFWNGFEPGTFIPRGDGDGFKLGPDESYIYGGGSAVHDSLCRILINCVAFENRQHGFNQNLGNMRVKLYNNTSCNNGHTGYMWDFVSPAPLQDFKNNISYSDVNVRRGGETNGTHNSWNGSVSLTAADFITTSSAGADGPRQADGSLPVLDYLHLASGSDLVNAGINVGLPFIGSAPDMGAFEYGTAPSMNLPPVADAGPDLVINMPALTTLLEGTGTDPDGTIANYNWTQITGPTGIVIANPLTASTLLTISLPGIYQFELKVTDNGGLIAKDTVKVTVIAQPNQGPSANAGPDQSVTLPVNTITLEGSGTDPDGTITSYLWTKKSGPAGGNITNITSSSTTVTGLITGIYFYALTVTDNRGASQTDSMQLTVHAAPNQAPEAHAGPDQEITLPTDYIVLNGSATDPDGNINSYNWVKLAGPASGSISNTASLTTTTTGLTAGIYQFELTVTDLNGANDRDTMQVTVNAGANQPPTANAGPNQSITLPVNTITLTGSGNDADGNIIAFNWNRLSGPAGSTITNNNTASTTVTGLLQGVYQFELTVTDNNGATDTDIMQVNVNAAAPPPNQAPTAFAGPDLTISLPTNTVSFSGSGIDPDGNITAYYWRKIGGPPGSSIVGANTTTPRVTGLVQGTYKFELKVSDNSGAASRDTLVVAVNPMPNQAPLANAGPDQIITLPTDAVSLDGSGTDADGNIIAYTWAKVSGPASGMINNGTTATAMATGLAQGIYNFELRVTDNSGASAKDTIQVTVNAAVNQPPIADAGFDQTITLPATVVTLTGTGTDPDGTITAYSWRKIAGPTGGIVSNNSIASTTATSLTQGLYKFELKVTDNSGATDLDTMMVNVNAAPPPPNQGPTANAGNDQTITLPNSNVPLNGTGADPDGTITAYSWRKIAGPTGGIVSNNSIASTTATSLTQGLYKFELKVTDNSGATDLDTMMVNVNAAPPPPNQGPTANAGNDQNITLPNSNLSLNGSGTDPDGTITAYSWRKIAGPTGGIVSNNSIASTTATSLTQGLYKFELKVTDNSGATDLDTMMVNVNAAPPPPNQGPTANAGNDQNITLPNSSVALNGSGTDPDGTITAYSWRKIAGPTGGIVSNNSIASTTATSLTQGLYKFELKVTDNSGATDLDTMMVNVNAAPPPPNQGPTANAGNDQNITLPNSNVSLNGTGIDPDGTITAYSWRKIAGPTGGIVSNNSIASTTATSLTQGVYKFELKVTDNSGATDLDTMMVNVNAAPPPPNQGPTANAGNDLNITLPNSNVSLNGTGIDPDGTITAYSWRKIAGPTGGIVSNNSIASTTATSLTQGVYKFELKVTDNSGATDLDTMMVNVNAAPPPPNQGPTANAGNDLNITLPNNSVSLNGSGTDPDGTIAAYSWRKIAGPTGGNVSNNSIASTTATPLTQGLYKFELKVTDNSGATDLDTMLVNVNAAPPPPNQLPTVNAGTDTSIYLPVNTLNLYGSASDPDGTLTAYNWRIISGSVCLLMNANSVIATLSNLQQGIYEAELSVTDNRGAVVKDTVKITVGAARLHTENEDVTILGNPVMHSLAIKITSPTVNRQAKIFIFDMRGALILNKNIQLNQNIQLETISLSNFSSGTYILHAYFDNNVIITRKVVKSK